MSHAKNSSALQWRGTRSAVRISLEGWHSTCPSSLDFSTRSQKMRTPGRRYGRSRKGRRAQKKQVFVRGRRVSAEALLTLDGIVAGTVVKGLMTKAMYMEYLALNVVSILDSSFCSSHAPL